MYILSIKSKHQNEFIKKFLPVLRFDFFCRKWKSVNVFLIQNCSTLMALEDYVGDSVITFSLFPVWRQSLLSNLFLFYPTPTDREQSKQHSKAHNYPLIKKCELRNNKFSSVFFLTLNHFILFIPNGSIQSNQITTATFSRFKETAVPANA